MRTSIWFSPYKRAGRTRVLFITSASPGCNSSMISWKCLSSISPVFRSKQVNENDRGLLMVFVRLILPASQNQNLLLLTYRHSLSIMCFIILSCFSFCWQNQHFFTSIFVFLNKKTTLFVFFIVLGILVIDSSSLKIEKEVAP